MRLIELASDPDSSLDDIRKVVSADPKLAARIIDYTNSPLNGIGKEVASLQQAVVVLGLRSLRLLSLSFSLAETKNDGGFDFPTFWRNSMLTAIAAQSLEFQGCKSEEEDFLLGLLFNIGAIAIGASDPERLATYDAYRNIEERSQAEMTELGATRYQIGGTLLRKWNFPERMVERLESFTGKESVGLQRFYLAQLVSELVRDDGVDPEKIESVRAECAELAGLDGEGFSNWFNQICREFLGFEDLFEMDSFSFVSLEEMEQRAKDSIFRISMGLEFELKKVSEEKQELESNAVLDSLTGLKNRQAYNSELEAAIEYHQRRKSSLSLLVIDIDHFKSFNDTYGHAVGDEVLASVAQRLADSARKYDNVYRYGGEEFVAIIVDCNLENTVLVAERLRKSVEEIKLEQLEGKRNITVSIGGYNLQLDSESSDSLFEAADKALYEAKNSGRNRTIIWDKATLPSGVQLESSMG